MYSQNLKSSWVIFILGGFLSIVHIHAQSSCSLGNLVFEEDFGSGTSRLGSSLNQNPSTAHPNFRPADLYSYKGSGSIGQDEYGIIKNGKDAAPGGASWNDDFRDHTGNMNGYMYYCDAKEDLNVFYSQKITGVCAEIEYELSAWFAKTNAPDYFIDPNVKMIVGFTDVNDLDLGTVDVNTGSIEGDGGNRWHRKELVFTVPVNTENVYFMLKNNVAGVSGNDLAIDDIQIRPCGPEIEISDLKTNSVISENEVYCLNDSNNLDIHLSASIASGFVMQWQESLAPDEWIDIPNETTSTLNYTLGNNSSSHHYIRLKFAHNQSNLLNSNCYFFSNEIEFSKAFANPVDDLVRCDDLSDGDDFNGITGAFDLESQTLSVLGKDQTTADYSVTYHLNSLDAISGANPLSSPHVNSLSPNLQEIYVRVLNEKTGCVNTSESFNLQVVSIPDGATIDNIEVCDDDMDGDDANGVFQKFDLEFQTDLILNGRLKTDFNVTYHLLKDEAISGGNPLASPHANDASPHTQTIYVRIQNMLTGCINPNINFDVVVHNLPLVNSVDNLSMCDDLNDGDDLNGIVQSFDLESQTSQILGSVQKLSDYSVSYYESASDAISRTNALTSPHSNELSPFQQTIFTSILNKNTGCLTLGLTFDLIVHPLPIISSSVELKQCDNDVDGFSAFNLTEVNSKISSNMNNEIFSYYTSYTEAHAGVNAILNPSAYTNQQVSSDKVWARVVSSVGCSRISEIELIVSTTGIPSDFHREFSSCDDFIDEVNGDTDGISTFNFSDVDNEVRAIFPVGQQLIINYYRNEHDALAEINAIQDISNYRNIGFANTQEIYIRVDSALNNDCLGFGAHITLNVETLPKFEVDNSRIICESGTSSTITLEVELQDPNEVYAYQWEDERRNFLSSDNELDVSQSGSYFVTLYKTDGAGCSKEREIVVVFSETANIELGDIEIEDDSDNNRIIIHNENNNLGAGDYEFSLDDPDFGFQSVSYFENVSPGIHTIFIRDKNGCDSTQIEVSVIGYPKFFTPNNDGHNDSWKVLGVNHEFYASSVMYIYDRFGKIIEKIDPRLEGWDGTYNGALLQANDYWFSVELIDNEGVMSTKRGHFSLIRR